jgi:hypothetical protein
MDNLVNLMSLAGAEKTLIISCGECGISKHIEFNDQIFIYALTESTLRNHDPLEKGMIQYYIESKECKQVVIVGSIQQHLIERLIQSESLVSPAASLKFNLKVFLQNREKQILSETLRDQMLVELHVISQCNLLMDYYFIHDRVSKGRLHVKGVVIEPAEGNLKEIFYNGTIYNDIISMN